MFILLLTDINNLMFLQIVANLDQYMESKDAANKELVPLIAVCLKQAKY